MYNYDWEEKANFGHHPSELHPALMSLGASNPWIRCTSASRQQMNASQMGQILRMIKSANKKIFTGMEFEFGRFTHYVKVENDSRVYDVINKYSGSVGGRKLESPLTTVILIGRENDIVDVAEVPSFYCNHEFFGFKYVRSDIMNDISPGSAIQANTILADTPAKDKQGNYAYGKPINTAFTSGQGGIEDGVRISEEILEEMKVNAYGYRTASWGKESIPLNLHGNLDVYKTIPDIGSYIDESGLIFARRPYRLETAPANLTAKALQQPSTNDMLTYGEPGARIIDVQVVKGRDSKNLAPEWLEQCNFYWEKTLQYCRRIRDADEYFIKTFGKNYLHTPRWSQLVQTSLAYIHSNEAGSRIQLTNGRAAIDDWEVKVIFEYQYKPNYGSKLTDHHGGKGVITSIVPARQMLKDADGNVAHIEQDAASKVNRMNYGGVHEQLAGAVILRVERILQEKFDAGENYEDLFKFIMGLYKIYSPNNYEIMSQDHINKVDHVEHVLEHGIYLMAPSDNPVDYARIAVGLKFTPYGPCRGRCTFEDADGIVHTTTYRVMIGPVYWLLLERAGNQLSAVSSPKLQHFAAPSKQSKTDKFSSHAKLQPTRSGESESRGENAACGGIWGAEKIDRANNPKSHDSEISAILDAENPSDIKNAVDRKKVPLTGGVIKELQENILGCTGTMIVDCNDDYLE